MQRLARVLVVVAVLLVASQAPASVIIDFEGMPDLVSVTDQYEALGVRFDNALILTAYYSLNEIDFPPVSGEQVLGDDLAPIVATFLVPVNYVGSYFTYSQTLNLYAYDSADNLLAVASSLAYDNYGSSEFIWLNSPSTISRLVIAGSEFGGSYIMDDFEFNGSAVVPAPGAMLLGIIGTGLVGLAPRLKLLKRP